MVDRMFALIGSIWTILKFICLAVAVIGSCGLFLIYWNQERLMFHPEVPAGCETCEKNPPGLRSPGEYNVPFENINILTPDGETLQGWLMMHPIDSAKLPTIIFFQGNAGNMGLRLPNLTALYRKLPANIVAVSYRGFGYNTGVPSEKGVYTDAQAILDFIFNEKKNRLNLNQIFLFGRSLGGAVAVHLFISNPSKIRGIILENTFTSVLEMVKEVFPPMKFLPDSFLKFIMRLDMNTLLKLKGAVAQTHSHVHFLFISGADDQLVPPRQMEQLFDECVSTKKVLMRILKGGHNDSWQIGGHEYYEEYKAFVNGCINDTVVPHIKEIGYPSTKTKRPACPTPTGRGSASPVLNPDPVDPVVDNGKDSDCENENGACPVQPSSPHINGNELISSSMLMKTNEGQSLFAAAMAASMTLDSDSKKEE